MRERSQNVTAAKGGPEYRAPQFGTVAYRVSWKAVDSPAIAFDDPLPGQTLEPVPIDACGAGLGRREEPLLTLYHIAQSGKVIPTNPLCWDHVNMVRFSHHIDK